MRTEARRSYLQMLRQQGYSVVPACLLWDELNFSSWGEAQLRNLLKICNLKDGSVVARLAYNGVLLDRPSPLNPLHQCGVLTAVPRSQLEPLAELLRSLYTEREVVSGLPKLHHLINDELAKPPIKTI